MSNYNLVKGKHLTMEDRILIEYSLDQNYPLKVISKKLGKDPTTISKEIKRNRITKKSSKAGQDLLRCESRKDCTKTNLCTSHNCNNLCKKCSFINCYRTCDKYSTKTCSKLNRFPYVCNGCDSINTCKCEKNYYKSKVANAKYKDLLVSSRDGLNITSDKLKEIDEIISPLILKGQSLYHIYTHHKEELKLSQRTIYSYLDKNILTARNIDLPRKVKYKPRKKDTKPKIKEQNYRVNRTYADFIKFLEDNPDTNVVEMDTVHGKRSGKVMLTFFFRNSSFMIALLIDSCSQEHVKKAIDMIYEEIGSEVFKKSFPVILTDNGSEFKNPDELENYNNREKRTRIFYCNPMASYQKPHVEKNHEYIRYVIPKGKSFDNRNQEDITLMINHINSAARASLNGTTPFKLAQMLLDNKILNTFNFKHIPSDEVHLKPALFKK